MTWLIWRQHRRQLVFAGVALVVLGAFFFGTGRPMHDRFERLGLPECLPEVRQEPVVLDLAALGVPGTPGPAPGPESAPDGGQRSPDEGTVQLDEGTFVLDELDDALLANGRCAQTARTFYGDYQSVPFAGLLLLVLPMLVGMFWGAPLVAREIEHGTHRLVWTQGVSRLRWATTKIGLIALAVLAITAVYAVMLTWWITPVMETSGQRFAYVFFDIHGIVVFGYVVFALALGVFAGAVTGRLISALTTVVVGFVGVRLLVMLAARERFLATESLRLPNLDTDFPQMRNDLQGHWLVDGEGASTSPLAIHPADQFWTFQAIETAIFVALAVGLAVVSIHWIRRWVA
jgi:hypothetical protein